MAAGGVVIAVNLLRIFPTSEKDLPKKDFIFIKLNHKKETSEMRRSNIGRTAAAHRVSLSSHSLEENHTPFSFIIANGKCCVLNAEHSHNVVDFSVNTNPRTFGFNKPTVSTGAIPPTIA